MRPPGRAGGGAAVPPRPGDRLHGDGESGAGRSVCAPRTACTGTEILFRSSHFRPCSVSSWGMSSASDAFFPGKHFIFTVLEALDTKTRMTGALA